MFKKINLIPIIAILSACSSSAGGYSSSSNPSPPQYNGENQGTFDPASSNCNCEASPNLRSNNPSCNCSNSGDNSSDASLNNNEDDASSNDDSGNNNENDGSTSDDAGSSNDSGSNPDACIPIQPSYDLCKDHKCSSIDDGCGGTFYCGNEKECNECNSSYEKCCKEHSCLSPEKYVCNVALTNCYNLILQ